MSTQSYISFLWKSVNDHGIHSPFVYRFVSKAFYAKGTRLSRRDYQSQNGKIGYQQAELLYRIVNYLRPAKSFVLGEGTDAVTDLLRYTGDENKIKLWFFSPMAPIPGGTDFAVVAEKQLDAMEASFEKIVSNTNNDTVCIVCNIHQTEQAEAGWRSIQAHPKATVTIDAYHLGIVFFRREQAGQHLMVRPSKSFFTEVLLGLRNLYGLLG